MVPKFEHLILLMGTSPLPNYVAARFFMEKVPGMRKIWLVCSRENQALRQAGTMEHAEILEKVLKKKTAPERTEGGGFLFPCRKIEVADASNADSIKEVFRSSLIEEIRNSGSFHLNYTGGTKSMSAHAYRLLAAESKEFQLGGSFSYLDARSFRLVMDYPSYTLLSPDMRKEVGISLEHLVELHGFERINQDEETGFSDAITGFSELIEKDELPVFYEKKGGWDHALFTSAKGGLADKPGKLVEENKKFLENEFVPNDAFFGIVNRMPEEYHLFDGDRKFRLNMTAKEFKKAVGFLDGKWLEDYAAEVLKGEFAKKGIDVLQNWVVKKEKWGGDFELDILVVNGYELTGISCTTADRKEICKNKGFEILHRTRQIGGAEAKTVLISFLDKQLETTRQELLQDTGGKENILVLGREDLKKEKLIRNVKNFCL